MPAVPQPHPVAGGSDIILLGELKPSPDVTEIPRVPHHHTFTSCLLAQRARVVSITCIRSSSILPRACQSCYPLRRYLTDAPQSTLGAGSCRAVHPSSTLGSHSSPLTAAYSLHYGHTTVISRLRPCPVLTAVCASQNKALWQAVCVIGRLAVLGLTFRHVE